MQFTGGCLCGAIRYEASAELQWASYCHCTMCRKATGAPLAGFVECPAETLTWTTVRPAAFNSSPGVSRKFCATCGSSLTFEADGIVFLALGSLDEPEAVKMKAHTYTQAKLPGVKLNDGLPQYPGPVGGKGGRPID